MTGDGPKQIPYYERVEGLINTLDLLNLEPSHPESMFADIKVQANHKKSALDSAADGRFKEIIEKLNLKLPQDCQLDYQECKERYSADDVKDMVKNIRQYCQEELQKYVKKLNPTQENVILICLYKYFLEKADENLEYFRQRTVSLEEGSHIVEKTQKIMSLILDSNVNFDNVMDYLKNLMDPKEISKTDRQALFDLFLSRVQK